MPKGGFATANNLMEKYERERVRRVHKQKLSNMKAGVDNKAPNTYPHLVLRLNRLQKEEERQSLVEHDNRLLLHKIGAIMTRPGKVDNWNGYESRSLNTGYRERLLEQIAIENIGIGKRLGNVKPIYDTQKWEEDYRRHNYLMEKWAEQGKVYPGISPRNSRTEEDYRRHNYLMEKWAEQGKDYPGISPRNSRNKTQYESDREMTSDSHLPDIGGKRREQTTASTTNNDVRLPPVQQGKKGEGSNMAESDAKQLFKVAKGMSPPDDVLLKTLARRTRKQRAATSDKFSQLFDLDLATELKHTLGPKWSVLIDGLLTPRESTDATVLYKSLTDKKYGEIVAMLSNRDQSEKSKLNYSYKKEYGSKLESHIKEKTTGPLQTLLLKLLAEDVTEIGEEECEEDTQEMLNPEEWRFESSYAKLCSLLDGKSVLHVRATFTSIKPATRCQEVLTKLKKDCDDDTFIDALTALVRSEQDMDTMYASKLFNHLDPKDPVFVGVLVDRAEVDMASVRKAYKKKYGDDLVEDLKERGPHPTNKILVDLITAGARSNSPKRRAGVAIKPQSKQKPVRQPPRNQERQNTDKGPSPLQQRGHRPLMEVKQKQSEPSKDEKKLDGDVAKLHDSVKGLGTDEDLLIEVLVGKTNVQRQKLRAKYQEKYQQDLMETLRSELRGDFEEIVLALLQTPAEYDARCLNDAVQGAGTDEAVLIGILTTRSEKEMSAIKDMYEKEYGSSLESAIAGDTSGAFKSLCVGLVRGGRDTGERVNKGEARDHATQMYQCVKDNNFNTDLLQTILTSKNRHQISDFLKQYKQLSGHELREDIKTCLSGDDEDGYVGLVSALEDPVLFYAERLYRAFDGAGTNDSTVIRIIVSRSEIDLKEIAGVYAEKYGKTLRENIESECSGDYRNILVALIDLKEIAGVYAEKYGKTLRENIESECSGDYRNILVALVGG